MSVRSVAKSGGNVRPHATAQASIGTVRGVASPTTIRAATDAGKPAAQTTSTGVWPTRSISRPRIGAAIPAAIANAPVAAPATANEPVSLLTKSTVASENMPTGSRPTNAAASSDAMCGFASTA